MAGVAHWGRSLGRLGACHLPLLVLVVPSSYPALGHLGRRGTLRGLKIGHVARPLGIRGYSEWCRERRVMQSETLKVCLVGAGSLTECAGWGVYRGRYCR